MEEIRSFGFLHFPLDKRLSSSYNVGDHPDDIQNGDLPLLDRRGGCMLTNKKFFEKCMIVKT